MNGGLDGHRSNGRDLVDSIDELLDHAVAAINRGDRATATVLAEQVLAADSANAEAEDLLAAPSHPGEIRRLTLFFADLVDSTVLSTRVEPETYRLLIGRYREQVLRAVNRYEGHIGSTAGDGLLAVFGHPIAHEDDVRRAVHAGLEIVREVARLSEQARRRFGIEIHVRVGVHRGLVYLDTAQDDVYGLAANLAARVSGLAPPGAVVVSDAVEMLIRNDFELEARPPALVKGVAEPIIHYRVVAERAPASKSGQGPLVGRDREMARLQKSWTRAQAGTLTTPGVVFRGEPGIGKSRPRPRPPSWWRPPGRGCWNWLGRHFTPTQACTRYARYWSGAAASTATLISSNGCGYWTPRSAPADWIRLALSRCWRRCWASKRRPATSRWLPRAENSTS